MKKKYSNRVCIQRVAIRRSNSTILYIICSDVDDRAFDVPIYIYIILYTLQIACILIILKHSMCNTICRMLEYVVIVILYMPYPMRACA